MSSLIQVIVITEICLFFCFDLTSNTKAPKEGTGKISGAERIFESEKATPHSYPMVVAVTSSSGTIYCTASILNPHWVITSATCFSSLNDTSQLTFIAGAHDLYNLEGTEQRAKGIKFVPHERFNPKDKRHNIALVKIHPPFRLNPYVIPTNLPTCNSETDVVGRHDMNLTGVICGFGIWQISAEIGKTVPVLREGYVNLLSVEACSEYLGNEKLTDNIICINRAAACVGDDGLPLLIRDKNQRLIQIGVGAEECTKPQTFARLSKYLDWIKAVQTDECEQVVTKPCTSDSDCRSAGENYCCDTHKILITGLDIIYRGYCRDRKYARECRPKG